MAGQRFGFGVADGVSGISLPSRADRVASTSLERYGRALPLKQALFWFSMTWKRRGGNTSASPRDNQERSREQTFFAHLA